MTLVEDALALIGYARVSSVGQSLELQQEKLKHCDKVFEEKKSGVSGKRPRLADCLEYVREGDTLVVDTVGFLPGFITTPVRHSDKLHVVERFTLDPQTLRLTRQYEAEDPLYLKGKYTGQDVVQPADAPYAEVRCEELTSRNYSQQGGAPAPAR